MHQSGTVPPRRAVAKCCVFAARACCIAGLCLRVAAMLINIANSFYTRSATKPMTIRTDAMQTTRTTKVGAGVCSRFDIAGMCPQHRLSAGDTR